MVGQSAAVGPPLRRARDDASELEMQHDATRIEQAAAASGEQNEARIADRISQQNDELERLMKERDARSTR